MKKENEFVQFLVGLAILVGGGFLFSQNVIVYTGFHTWALGSMRIGAGLIVVPFIVGVIMLFAIPNKFVSKLVCGIGLLIILISVIMGTEFHFRATSLYVYLLMLIGIFGGLALVLKVLLKQPNEENSSKEPFSSTTSTATTNVDEELDKLRKKYK